MSIESTEVADKWQLAERIALALDDIYQVGQPTPVDCLRLPDTGCALLKREDLSEIRSYKWRGAYNKMARCSRAGDAGPFVATSAGNHAQGVALAARHLGVRAFIFMPRTTPLLKQRSVAALGQDHVTVELVGDTYDDAAAAADEWMETNRATVVPAFEDLDVIAGQATVGIELIDQHPDVDVIFVPVGGGGLAAGISFAARNTHARVIGVEATGQDSMRRSLESQAPITLQDVDRFCDGTGVKRPGQTTFEICQRHLERVITVGNEQVCSAIEICWNQRRLIPEPSGALALAGLIQASLEGWIDPAAQACAAIITGGNTDFLNLPTIVRGSRMSGTTRRFLRFDIAERDGSLIELLNNFLIGFNIVDFQYGKTSRDQASPVLGLSGTQEQFADLLVALRSAGQVCHEVTQRETVVFRVIPFRADLIEDPIFLHIDFPERPGALRALMQPVSDFGGICYFNYAESGTQEGQALIGFECDQRERLFGELQALGYPYHEIEMGSLVGRVKEG